jgi:glutamate-1-semialdehyde 2,1-aminomutase
MNFNWSDLTSFINKNRDIFHLNNQYIRNEGSNKLSGQKLWDRAKKIIPGGNMLLSKRPDMFLPNKWPTYFSRAKGCKVWDLDGKEYTDMSIMGIGTNILGYSNSEVDNAVKEAVNNGNMSTFNCPEEVELAEKLISMHGWADMARFARSGGEANSIAIRIARAASGKEKVAICGYHGWHDWYLATNLENNSALKDHLLPGLDPKGVPSQLKGTVFPFRYNQFNELNEIVQENDIGVVKMEVERNNPPEENFLQKIRQLCDEKGIVLIFDECTSGFRETFGGLHKKYQVEPDMAMFGKAIGNGFALTSIIGRKVIMEAAQNTFISSTFWTERIGSVASLKTLEIMERMESWKFITQQGQKIKKGWQSIADYYGIDINIGGLDALASFSFVHRDNLKFKTLITQEMLKKNFLAGNCCYVCIDHSDEIIDMYFNNLLEIFNLISMCINEEELIENLLENGICTSGFKRLN